MSETETIEAPTPPPSGPKFEGGETGLREAAEEVSRTRLAGDIPLNPTLATDEGEPADVVELPEGSDDEMSIRNAGKALVEVRRQREEAKALFDQAAGEPQPEQPPPLETE